MKQKKLVKVERITPNECAIVGQLTDHIYYRFNWPDCCFRLGIYRSEYELEEQNSYNEYEQQQSLEM